MAKVEMLSRAGKALAGLFDTSTPYDDALQVARARMNAAAKAYDATMVAEFDPSSVTLADGLNSKQRGMKLHKAYKRFQRENGIDKAKSEYDLASSAYDIASYPQRQYLRDAWPGNETVSDALRGLLDQHGVPYQSSEALTGSRYIVAEMPDGSEATLRVGDHPSPPGGGYDAGLDTRHGDPDVDLSPTTFDAGLQQLKGKGLVSLAPLAAGAGVAGGLMASPEETWAAYRATAQPTDAIEEAWNPAEALAGGLGGGLLGALAGVPVDLATDMGLQGLLKLLAADATAQNDTPRTWR